MYKHTRLHTHMYTYTHTYTSMCIHVHTHMKEHTHIHVCHSLVCKYTDTYTCTLRKFVNTFTFIFKRVHVYKTHTNQLWNVYAWEAGIVKLTHYMYKQTCTHVYSVISPIQENTGTKQYTHEEMHFPFCSIILHTLYNRGFVNHVI